MDRITRKELKQDKFAEEVGLTVEYFTEHRKQVIRYSVIGAAVVLLVLGVFSWRRYQHSARQTALNAALEIQNAPIGPAQPDGPRSYPSQAERDKAATKAFADVAARYSGSDEGAIASYYLGVMAADQGRLAEAQKFFQQVIDNGSANYASLGKLALADLYRAEGKTGEGEKLLRSLVDKPTDFVSKEQATIALARLRAASNPAEARKLLEPLRSTRGAISRASIGALGELAQQTK